MLLQFHEKTAVGQVNDFEKIENVLKYAIGLNIFNYAIYGKMLFLPLKQFDETLISEIKRTFKIIETLENIYNN